MKPKSIVTLVIHDCNNSVLGYEKFHFKVKIQLFNFILHNKKRVNARSLSKMNANTNGRIQLFLLNKNAQT